MAPRDRNKCQECRLQKKKCSPSNRVWNDYRREKCALCLQRQKPCGPPETHKEGAARTVRNLSLSATQDKSGLPTPPDLLEGDFPGPTPMGSFGPSAEPGYEPVWQHQLGLTPLQAIVLLLNTLRVVRYILADTAILQGPQRTASLQEVESFLRSSYVWTYNQLDDLQRKAIELRLDTPERVATIRSLVDVELYPDAHSNDTYGVIPGLHSQDTGHLQQLVAKLPLDLCQRIACTVAPDSPLEFMQIHVNEATYENLASKLGALFEIIQQDVPPSPWEARQVNISPAAHLAFLHGHTGMALSICCKTPGAYTQTDILGRSICHLAVSNSKLEFLRDLDRRQPELLPNIRADKSGLTVAISAALNGDPDSFSMLLDRHLSIEQDSGEVRIIIALAIRQRNALIMERLLAKRLVSTRSLVGHCHDAIVGGAENIAMELVKVLDDNQWCSTSDKEALLVRAEAVGMYQLSGNLRHMNPHQAQPQHGRDDVMSAVFNYAPDFNDQYTWNMCYGDNSSRDDHSKSAMQTAW